MMLLVLSSLTEIVPQFQVMSLAIAHYLKLVVLMLFSCIAMSKIIISRSADDTTFLLFFSEITCMSHLSAETSMNYQTLPVWPSEQYRLAYILLVTVECFLMCCFLS